jgi:hypothetical protein
MACDISLGRIEQCKDSNGGLAAVYFINFGDATSYTIVEDEITAVLGSPSAYKYELKGTSTFTQTVTSSRENGTTFVDQIVSLSLKKLTSADHKQLKLLSFGRPQVIIEDNNGNRFLAGLTKGVDLTSNVISTGAALGDASGYQIEMQGMEPIAANFVIGDLTTIGFTIVLGS